MGLLKKIFKPVSKVLDKIIPNEIKPLLPYAASFAPYMFPGMGAAGLGSLSPMMTRALMSGGLNIGAQLAQEGSEGDINLLSAGLGALQGAMTTPGAADKFLGMRYGTPASAENIHGAKFLTGGLDQTGITGLQRAANIGLEGLSKGSGWIEKGMAGDFVDKAKVLTIPGAQATGDVMAAQANRDLKDLAKDVVDDMGGGYTDDAYRAAIRKSMTAYGATEEEIVEAIIAAGYKSGGRVGMISGGGVKAAWNAMKAGASKMKSLFDDADINVSIRDEDVMTDWGPQAQAVGQDVFVTAKSGKSTKVLDDLIEEGYDITKDGNTYSINAIDEGALDIITQKLKIGSKGADEFIESQEYFMPGKTVDTSMMDEESKMIYEALKNKKASGGRVGFAFGGIDSAVEQVDDVEMKENIKFAQNMDIPMETVVEKFIIKFKRKPNNLDELKRFYKTISQSDMNIKETITERMTAKDGGMMSVLPRNKEMDYRAGGMIPMGSKERADDVPARLSKNEFVMTADAVRAAGGGSVNEGARRMYNLMNNLEARA